VGLLIILLVPFHSPSLPPSLLCHSITGVSSRPVVPWSLLPLLLQDLYMLYTYLPK